MTSNGIATLTIDGISYDLPVLRGSEGETALDTRGLREATGGVITLDPGYANTGSCESAITFIDGEQGILRYRGYPIEQLAEHASFLEICRLLIYGALPNSTQLSRLIADVIRYSHLPEKLKAMFTGYPRTAHPMTVLSGAVGALEAYYPANKNEDGDTDVVRLLAKVPMLAASWLRYTRREELSLFPKNSSYAGDLLHMLLAPKGKRYEVPSTLERALNLLLILHADHEQNCSTSTVRMVGSSHANLYASIAAGIAALSGPLHGAANQRVIEMLRMIHEDGNDYQKYVDKAKNKEDSFRLMGFGHRVYKNFDPRALILKRAADEVLEELGINDPLLEIAKNLERVALEDEFFIERRLYPNVDFYSGIIYSAMRIPVNMFTVMFALGRLPGWIAQWKEMHDDPKNRINRPRQVYTGPKQRDWVTIDER